MHGQDHLVGIVDRTLSWLIDIVSSLLIEQRNALTKFQSGYHMLPTEKRLQQGASHTCI